MSIKGLAKCIIKAAEDAGYEPEKSLYKATIFYDGVGMTHIVTLSANDMGHFFQRLAAHLPVKEPDRVVVLRISKAEPSEEKKLKKPVTKSISCCPKCGNALVTTIMGRRCLDRACDFAIVDEQERQAFMRNPQGLG